MNAYLTQSIISLKLTFRDKTVIFFSYAFPLIFFFVFAGLFKAERGGAIVQVLTMVLTIGILGTGFFGAGIRAVADRELGILRRFKVAPITPGPMLAASVFTGIVNYLPGAVVMVLLSHYLYGMPFPGRPVSLLAYIMLGVICFRAIGLIIASVVNSTQESQIIVQLLYFPMLMLSGATIPLTILPQWLQQVAQFIPSTYVITGMQAIIGRNETFWQNLSGAVALLFTSALALFVCLKLFRWERDERLPRTSKVWLVAALAPFLVLGVYQARTHDNVVKAKALVHDQRRNRTFLIRDVRIFVGDGRVIENGSVLSKAGRIEQIFNGPPPDEAKVNADVIDGSGKTLLPGLIDMHVHLAAPGGVIGSPQDINLDAQIPRELAAYLYSGITAVKSAGDPLGAVKKFRRSIDAGERLGAELFYCGPLFTAPAGHGTEYFKDMPDSMRRLAEGESIRTPQSAAEARREVAELQQAGVQSIKVILDGGQAGQLFNRMDPAILQAIAAEARERRLPLTVHTGDSKDIADALDAGASLIEHGSVRDVIPEALFSRMKQAGVAYDPTLSVYEAIDDWRSGVTDSLDRTLVQQVGPAKLIADTRAAMQGKGKLKSNLLDRGKQNLASAWKCGVTLVTGSDAGNILVWHGPTVHLEMQLWVSAGLPPAVALQAATGNAAARLGRQDRIGLIQPGREASLLLVSGNPLKDIAATESIQAVYFKGERVERPDLFDQN